MKRKEPPGGSTKKAIRPVLYYPDAAEDEPSQVIMPSSPPLGPRASPDRTLARHRRALDTSTRRRSAVDNIGYEPENIPTPRASLYLSAQSSPVRPYTARVQPSSVKAGTSASRLFVPVRFAPPPVQVVPNNHDDDDESDYVVDTDDERPETRTVSTTSPRAIPSPFKSTRPFEPHRRLFSSPTKTQSPTKPRASPDKPPSPVLAPSPKPPSPTEVIDLLSSSDSEPEPTPTPSSPTRRSESRSLGSPEIQLINPPISSDVEEVTIPPRPTTYKSQRRRRIVSSPVDEAPWRHVRSELRRRPLAPEFGDSSSFRSGSMPRASASGSGDGSGAASSASSRPGLASRGSEEIFFRPAVQELIETHSDVEVSVGEPDDVQPVQPEAEPLPPSSPPQPTSSIHTPAASEPEPEPATELPAPKVPPRVIRMRMECVLLPRPSKATLNALARFENQTRAAGSGKGKGKAKFVIEMPKTRGRKSVAGGIGKGKGGGKGGYAAREEGRWESLSPVRDGAGAGFSTLIQEDEEPVPVEEDADVNVDMDMEVDEIDLIRTREEDENEFIVVDGDESADDEPEISYVGTKTPSNRKRGRKSGSRSTRKRHQSPSPSPSPIVPAQTPRTLRRQPDPRTPRRRQLDPNADIASAYQSLPDDIATSGDKYCHCCRTVKNGKLKMRCRNQVSRARKGRASKVVTDGEVHLCGSWWCQRCAFRNGLEFDLLAEEFTCPLCDDTCVCDKCSKRREQEELAKDRVDRRPSGEGVQPEQEQVEEEEEAAEQGQGEQEQEQEQQEPEVRDDGPEPAHGSSTLPEPSLAEGEEPVIPTPPTNDPNAKRAGYAELMRQRGPTKWHGRRTPPPLRHAVVSMHDVYIPRGPVEGTETTESRTISPSLRDDSPLASESPVANDIPLDDDTLMLQNMMMASFNGDFLASGEGSFMGADSAGLAIEMEELLRVDELTSAETEGLNEAILGLGPPSTLLDDDAVFEGLDANLRAAASQHFYDPAPRSHLSHLRFGMEQDVMLASPSLDPFGFDEEHLGVITPAQLSRSPTIDPYLEPVQPAPPIFDTEPSQPTLPIPGFEPEPAQPDTEPEPEVMPDLTMAESAKSTDLETPSPQFDADAGLLEGMGGAGELQDLFGGQMSGISDETEVEVIKSSPASVESSEFSAETEPVAPAPAEPTPVETTPVENTPTHDATESSDTPSSSFTFVAPTPDDVTQVRSSLKRRFQAQTQAQAPDQGRVTRSRSRRSL